MTRCEDFVRYCIYIVRWGKKKQKTLSLILFKSTELLVIGNTTIRWGLHRVIRGYIVYEFLYPPQRKKTKKNWVILASKPSGVKKNTPVYLVNYS